MLPWSESNWKNNKKMEQTNRIGISFVYLFSSLSPITAMRWMDEQKPQTKKKKKSNYANRIETGSKYIMYIEDQLLSQWHQLFYSWLIIWNLVAAPSWREVNAAQRHTNRHRYISRAKGHFFHSSTSFDFIFTAQQLKIVCVRFFFPVVYFLIR